MAGVVVGLLPKNCCFCDTIAECGIPCIAEKREPALKLTMFLSAVGLALAVLGAVGGYSKGSLGEHLAWAKYDASGHTNVGSSAHARALFGDKGDENNEFTHAAPKQSDESKGSSTPSSEWYAGVKYLCSAATNECNKFKDMNCGKELSQSTCESCASVADKAAIPVLITAITYALYAHNTYKRMSGHDSNQAKIMCMWACLFAGWNFLGTVMAYNEMCVKGVTEHTASMGPGLLMAGFGGAFLKFVCGFLHFALPVEHDGTHDELHDGSSDCEETETQE